MSLCFEGKVVQCKLTFKPSELCYPLFAKMPQRLLCSIYCGQMKSAQTTSVSGYRIVIGLLARTGLSNLSNLNRESRHQWGQLQWLMSLVSRLAMHHRVGVTFFSTERTARFITNFFLYPVFKTDIKLWIHSMTEVMHLAVGSRNTDRITIALV